MHTHTFRSLQSLLRRRRAPSTATRPIGVAPRIAGDGHQGVNEGLLGISESGGAGVGGSEQEVLQGRVEFQGVGGQEGLEHVAAGALGGRGGSLGKESAAGAGGSTALSQQARGLKNTKEETLQ